MLIYNLKNRWRLNKSEFLSVLAPAILIVSTIFLFGPATIYSGNISEFNVGFIDILKYYLVPSIILLVIFLLIGTLLPRKYLSMFVSLELTVGILLWVQGNFLLWKQGPLGIVDIDWAKNVWRTYLDGTLWIAFLCLSYIFHKALRKVVVLVSVVLISVQLLYLAFITLQNPKIWKENAKFSLPITAPKEIFQFSSKQNVIHIILDEFQSTIFQEIIDEDPDYYYAALEGFTFFKETTGSFPTTLMSIPAILSEKVYKNNIPIHYFKDTVYKGRSITNVLYDSGYEVDFAVPVDWYSKGDSSNCYHIPVPYGVSQQEHEEANSALMLNLVLFRYAPSFLKKAIYKKQIWLPTLSLTKGDRQHWEGARHFAHKAFLQDLIDNMSVKRGEPVYKFIHLTTTHWPAVLNHDCQYAGKILPWTWENIKIQAKCSFDHFLEFLNKLKSLGIYESSFIILHADHGYWQIPGSAEELILKNSDRPLDGYFTNDKEYFAKIVCSALPLLAIKPPYSEGPLRISRAPTVLTDIPKTICSVLTLGEDFNGRMVFKIDPNERRERRFQYYDRLNRAGDDYFERMDEFVIKGSAFDKASWRFSGHLSPVSSYQIKKVDFGTKEARRFLRSGWSQNEGSSKEGLSYQWAMGISASIFLSVPRDEAIRLTANAKTFLKTQQIAVRLDGVEIGTWDVSPSWRWERHSVFIDPDENRPNVSVVEFVFSQYWKSGGKDPRPLAVLFESITLNKAGLKR